MPEVKKVTYTVDGRYMDGASVLGYRAISSNGKKHRINKERIYGLIKGGQILNMEATTSNGKAILKGKGISLKDLPVLSDKGGLVKEGNDARLTDPSVIFTATGRCMQGQSVVAYVLMALDGTIAMVTPDEVRQLILARKIDNLFINNYNGKALIRGKGINIVDLPIFDVNTGAIRTEDGSSGKPVKDEKSMAQITLVKRIMNGAKNVGFVCMVGGVEKKVSRDKVIELAVAGRVTNAKANRYNDKVLLRGVGIQLEDLPLIKTGGENAPDRVVVQIRARIERDILKPVNDFLRAPSTHRIELASYIRGVSRYFHEQLDESGMSLEDIKTICINEYRAAIKKLKESGVKVVGQEKLDRAIYNIHIKMDKYGERLTTEERAEVVNNFPLYSKRVSGIIEGMLDSYENQGINIRKNEELMTRLGYLTKAAWERLKILHSDKEWEQKNARA